MGGATPLQEIMSSISGPESGIPALVATECNELLLLTISGK
jgi:hypothetical protein